MDDKFEKFNQLNLMVSVEDVFDYIGAQVEKEDGFRITYSCPYHSDDLPSLLVDQQTEKFNCFACECGGHGAYSCAKYYLAFTNNVKPTVIQVVNFLETINPSVGAIKHLFAVRQHREYDTSINKRKDFRNRLVFDGHTAAINAQKKNFTIEQKKIYIDAVMTGMPDEFIMTALKIRQSANRSSEGSKEFKSLIGEE